MFKRIDKPRIFILRVVMAFWLLFMTGFAGAMISDSLRSPDVVCIIKYVDEDGRLISTDTYNMVSADKCYAPPRPSSE